MISLRNENRNGATNFNRVTAFGMDLYFSYETVVAFSSSEAGLVISENIWGNTTGKHLNWLNDDKSVRIENYVFNKMLLEAQKAILKI